MGAGTITCNYDGANKWPTVIEDGAFIGSGSMLVAPLRIGKGATIGAGSTIGSNAPRGQAHPDAAAASHGGRLGSPPQIRRRGVRRGGRQRLEIPQGQALDVASTAAIGAVVRAAYRCTHLDRCAFPVRQEIRGILQQCRNYLIRLVSSNLAQEVLSTKSPLRALGARHRSRDRDGDR